MAIYLMVTERDARALVAGHVPQKVKAQARRAVEWDFGRSERTKEMKQP
jgi:hypothetical protein